ncbi:MAG: 7,8-dihydroneopterin aldolase/epimerase/oxygenase [Chloroflexia bacterium]|jgi:dihydroneopterin aldolase|nr:7,8-dihydroneopterin aldolase/epimerase/oxygenase [Chloroflexia bacterium]
MSTKDGPEQAGAETGEIRLSNMVFFGTHGVNPEETALGQRFAVNLSLWLDLSQASRTDRLEDTVSYSAVYKLVRAVVEGEPSKLLEHLAGRILDRVLQYDARITGARVEVGKPSPPLKGSTTAEVSVVLERARARPGE